jgi:hypothetical protein
MNLRLLFFCSWVGFLVLSVPRCDASINADTYKDNACVSCHQNLPGKLSGVVEQWKQSVHYRNNVACDGCHGGDPSVKRDQFDSEEAFKNRSHLHRDREFLLVPRAESLFTSAVRGRAVSYFCGKCHANIKEKHLGSPHGELGNPSCLYCHGRGSHAIQEPSPKIIDLRSRREGGRCAVCHRAATMEAVSNIYHILVNAQMQLENSSKLYDWLEAHGYKNLAMEKMHHSSRETLSQLRQTFHSFNMAEINEFASSIGTTAELTKETYNMIESLGVAKARQAKLAIVSVLFLLTFAGLLLIYRKKYLH